uniref:Uncharacterized protein n=1 Tax=Romanomermis culicivorax TaxID=13658 RepID=A0A915JE75_ROMCU
MLRRRSSRRRQRPFHNRRTAAASGRTTMPLIAIDYDVRTLTCSRLDRRKTIIKSQDQKSSVIPDQNALPNIYLKTNSNSEKANITTPKSVLKPPWKTGTVTCSRVEVIRRFRDPKDVKKQRATWTVDSTHIPTAVINETPETAFNLRPTMPIKPANSISIEIRITTYKKGEKFRKKRKQFHFKFYIYLTAFTPNFTIFRVFKFQALKFKLFKFVAKESVEINWIKITKFVARNPEEKSRERKRQKKYIKSLKKLDCFKKLTTSVAIQTLIKSSVLTKKTAPITTDKAINKFRFKCKYCSQNVNGMPSGKTLNPKLAYSSQTPRTFYKKKY